AEVVRYRAGFRLRDDLERAILTHAKHHPQTSVEVTATARISAVRDQRVGGILPNRNIRGSAIEVLPVTGHTQRAVTLARKICFDEGFVNALRVLVESKLPDLPGYAGEYVCRSVLPQINSWRRAICRSSPQRAFAVSVHSLQLCDEQRGVAC